MIGAHHWGCLGADVQGYLVAPHISISVTEYCLLTLDLRSNMGAQTSYVKLSPERRKITKLSETFLAPTF